MNAAFTFEAFDARTQHRANGFQAAIVRLLQLAHEADRRGQRASADALNCAAKALES